MTNVKIQGFNGKRTENQMVNEGPTLVAPSSAPKGR